MITYFILAISLSLSISLVVKRFSIFGLIFTIGMFPFIVFLFVFRYDNLIEMYKEKVYGS